MAAPSSSSSGTALQPWYWRLVAMLSSYLPLLLMALLALGTWWLVKNTPDVDRNTVAAAPRHEPDYEMHEFSVRRFTPQGSLRAQIEGDELRHYPDTDTLEIDRVRVHAIGTDGRTTVASARRGIANGAGTEVQLVGGAQVHSEATPTAEAIDFRGEFLHAFLDTERVRSHLPVTVLRGGSQVTADGMEYDHLARTIEFRGHTRAVFAPRTAPVTPPRKEEPAR